MLRRVLLEKSRQQIFLVIVFFSVLFGFSINGIDMRYPMILLWVIFIMYRFGRLAWTREINWIVVYLLLLMGYSALFSVVKLTNDYFEFFRFARCLATLLLIGIVITTYQVTTNQMLSILKVLFFVHAMSVILCVIWPPLNQVLAPISKYTKPIYPLRSSGLLNGEDAAGYICICGLIFEMYTRISKQKSPLSIVTIVFIISTFFISRFTLVMTFLVLFITFAYLVITRRFSKASSLLVFLLPVVLVAIVVVVLTTPFANGLRAVLLNEIPILKRFYEIITSSYTDYSVFSNAVYRHISITDLSFIDIVIGTGVRRTVRQDSGYIKTIYSTGILGLLAGVIFHLMLIRNVKKHNRYGEVSRNEVVIIVLLIFNTLLWELKQSFMFSSTFFETLMCVYICMICNGKKKVVNCDRGD